MKRVVINHEGARSGAPLTGRMVAWREAERQHALALGRGDDLTNLMFAGLAVFALARTLEGRQN